MSVQALDLGLEAPPQRGLSLPRARLDELHALLTLDPIAGASPSRTLFVVSEAAKARLARRTCPSCLETVLTAPACAVVGYDFAFAVQLALSSQAAEPGDTDLAIRTASLGAALQGDGLIRAAAALGLGATPIANFDAAALRAEFFGETSATVVFVCRLDLNPGSSWRPECPKP